MTKRIPLSWMIVGCLSFGRLLFGDSQEESAPKTPLDPGTLRAQLGEARGVAGPEGTWPRTVVWQQEEYDYKSETLKTEERTFELKAKPMRIIPHAVGVAEVLWAICPRERIVAFNEFAADPSSSFIAEQVKKTGRVFQSKETELVIGYRPDLVFTVFYSGADFKEKLKQARIPFFDLGYFGDIDSIRSQIQLIGRIIGEERNAESLVKTIDTDMRNLQAKLPKASPPLRVLYYDEGGYVPGAASNFTSICDIIRVVNVGAEQGIKSWSQIDFETLLKWNPDIIVTPQEGGLREQLMANPILSHSRAVKNGRVYSVGGVYLRVASQYMILTANLLAGIIYEDAF